MSDVFSSATSNLRPIVEEDSFDVYEDSYFPLHRRWGGASADFLVSSFWGGHSDYIAPLLVASSTDLRNRQRWLLHSGEIAPIALHRAIASLFQEWVNSEMWDHPRLGFHGSMSYGATLRIDDDYDIVVAHGPIIGEAIHVAPAHPQESETQSELPLTSAFTPTRRLTEFWLRGTEAVREEAKADSALDFPDSPLSKEITEMQAQFGQRIRRMFASIANRQRHLGEPAPVVAKDGRFTMTVQAAILDRITVRPDEGSEFFELLYKELRHSIELGGGISGAWGRLRFSDSGIVMHLEPQAVPSEEHWEKARLIDE